DHHVRRVQAGCGDGRTGRPSPRGRPMAGGGETDRVATRACRGQRPDSAPAVTSSNATLLKPAGVAVPARTRITWCREMCCGKPRDRLLCSGLAPRQAAVPGINEGAPRISWEVLAARMRGTVARRAVRSGAFVVC